MRILKYVSEEFYLRKSL